MLILIYHCLCVTLLDKMLYVSLNQCLFESTIVCVLCIHIYVRELPLSSSVVYHWFWHGGDRIQVWKMIYITKSYVDFPIPGIKKLFKKFIIFFHPHIVLIWDKFFLFGRLTNTHLIMQWFVLNAKHFLNMTEFNEIQGK